MAAAVTALVGVFPSTASAAAAKVWVVHPGDSIQAVVDQAASGDTVKIDAGTYAQAVCIINKGLTIQGAGPGKTVLTNPASPPMADPDKCWQPGAPEGGPVEDVSAIKFYYPDKPVVVTGLSTYGHPEDGIIAWGAKGFTVTNTAGSHHGNYGILATAGSTNVTISNNVETGGDPYPADSGTAGISDADSANAKAVVANNTVTGWHLGVFLRESAYGVAANNTVTGNCVGILVFDDSATEKPDDTGRVEGGNWALLRNKSTANNQYCVAGRAGQFVVSGVGMSIVNAANVLVAGNTITDNVPNQEDNAPPIGFQPAGLSVLTFPQPAGTAGDDPGSATNVKVIGNTIVRNVPLDVLEGRDFVTGQVNVGATFVGNTCNVSDPPEICGG